MPQYELNKSRHITVCVNDHSKSFDDYILLQILETKSSIKYKTEMIKIKNDTLPRMELNRVPSVDFGVSVESPDYFQRQHSMISTHSYVSPFLQNNSLSLSKLFSQKKQLKPLTDSQQWTSRPHLSNFSQMKNDDGYLTGRKEQKLVASGLNNSMEFDQTFQAMTNLQSSPKVFHKKKGQFTTYLENHLLNVDLAGPLMGDERSPQRKEKTKQNIKKEQQQLLEATKQKYSRIKPNRQLSPLLEKTKIHRSRLRLNEQVHSQYREKENIRQKSKQFELPQINKYQLENSLFEMSQHYKKYKNDSLTKNFFISSLSNVKTVDFDKSGLIDGRKLRL